MDTKLSSADVDHDRDDDLYDLVEYATATGTARPNAKSAQDSKAMESSLRLQICRNKQNSAKAAQGLFADKMDALADAGKAIPQRGHRANE